MTKQEIDALIDKYKDEDLGSAYETWDSQSSQYDDSSARINYSMVREYKPKVIVEFGARTGRCTHDILKALIKNGGDYTFKSYELDDTLRESAQKNINKKLGKKAITIGGDVMKATDIPDGIDYLFVDNSHDEETTKWLFDTLIKKCKLGALIQIHDVPLRGDFEKTKDGAFPETDLIIEMHKACTLPLEKVYWTSEYSGWEASWWIYKPL